MFIREDYVDVLDFVERNGDREHLESSDFNEDEPEGLSFE